MTPVEILTSAKALISTPNHWTQGEMARNSKGDRATVADPDVACWCASGAISRVASDQPDSNGYASIHSAIRIIKMATDGQRLSVWNDSPERTHAEVMAAFDCAIEFAQQEGV